MYTRGILDVLCKKRVLGQLLAVLLTQRCFDISHLSRLGTRTHSSISIWLYTRSQCSGAAGALPDI